MKCPLCAGCGLVATCPICSAPDNVVALNLTPDEKRKLDWLAGMLTPPEVITWAGLLSRPAAIHLLSSWMRGAEEFKAKHGYPGKHGADAVRAALVRVSS
jgi:hypothetical protein